jgi:hypothetical protein
MLILAEPPWEVERGTALWQRQQPKESVVTEPFVGGRVVQLAQGTWRRRQLSAEQLEVEIQTYLVVRAPLFVDAAADILKAVAVCKELRLVLRELEAAEKKVRVKWS